MYPVLVSIGDFEITSFGVMVALAALAALTLFSRELKRSRLPEDAANAAVGGVIGGLIGAKLIWSIEFAGTAPFASLLFSRGGLSWFGGFAGGVGTGLWLLRRYRIPMVTGLAAAAPALALGHAIGRIGCFLVGDDYGKPSTLPWAVAFPKGLPPTTVPVHPTQLYEAVALAILLMLLLQWRRDGVPDRVVLGRYLVCAGVIRFLIEFVRVNAHILGPFTLAQLWSAGLIVGGAVLLVSRRAPALQHAPRSNPSRL
jgi:phosphatidylglycerol:prolipoprotein diacylglycerol transferase